MQEEPVILQHDRGSMTSTFKLGVGAQLCNVVLIFECKNVVKISKKEPDSGLMCRLIDVSRKMLFLSIEVYTICSTGSANKGRHSNSRLGGCQSPIR